MTPKRISVGADMVPVRVVILTLNGHVACAVASAERQLQPRDPRPLDRLPCRDRLGPRSGVARALPLRYRPRRHRPRQHDVPRATHRSRHAGPGGAAAELRRHAVLHVGRRRGALDPRRQVQHGRFGRRRHDVVAEAPARPRAARATRVARRPTRTPAPSRWPCCAASRRSCGSCPARPRMSGPISSPCSSGSRARTTTSPAWCGYWSAAMPAGPAPTSWAASRHPFRSNTRMWASTTLACPTASSRGSRIFRRARRRSAEPSGCSSCGPTFWPATPVTTTA